MRNKPNKEKLKEDFIKKAALLDPETAKENSSNMHSKWPIEISSDVNIDFEEGSELNKPVNLTLKEFEWNTIDKHVKSLGVAKAKWIRHAIYHMLSKEQEFYNKTDNK